MKLLTHAVVLDEYYLFADSFALLLQKECGMDMVQAFSNTEEFEQFMRDFGPEELYVFLDYYAPKDNGLRLLTEIKRFNPKAKVIFVISNLTSGVLRSIMQYRPHGILSKNSARETLMECVADVKAGRFYVAPMLAAKLLAESPQEAVTFTPRELEILKYFAEGFTIEETAQKIFLSKHTIVAHRRKMMAKVKGNTIAQLLTYAKEQGLI